MSKSFTDRPMESGRCIDQEMTCRKKLHLQKHRYSSLFENLRHVTASIRLLNRVR